MIGLCLVLFAWQCDTLKGPCLPSKVGVSFCQLIFLTSACWSPIPIKDLKIKI